MIPVRDNILERLFAVKDDGYARFQASLIPAISSDSIIGVRIPVLRKIAKTILREYGIDNLSEFTRALPHEYYEENLLHGMLIEQVKDFDTCIEMLVAFLPYIDNWAVCDVISPKIFARHKQDLLPYIENWIHSPQPFTIRYGTGMLMRYFLDDDFDPVFLQKVADIKSDEYYVNMMRAWFFATALAKQYERTLPFISAAVLDPFTLKMTIRKARESYRLSTEQKTEISRCIR